MSCIELQLYEYSNFEYIVIPEINAYYSNFVILNRIFYVFELRQLRGRGLENFNNSYLKYCKHDRVRVGRCVTDKFGSNCLRSGCSCGKVRLMNRNVNEIGGGTGTAM